MPQQAKAIFGVSADTLYRWEKKGAIRFYKRAGMTFVKVQEVLDYITNDMGD
ncbi:helix-turn-helix domain-containing protein [Roseibium sp.]|uniref:helix-turn-helix domain-containing protein n=1 Tax=Roseibium sp. TaxID=1936156 RepID=UPI003A969B44